MKNVIKPMVINLFVTTRKIDCNLNYIHVKAYSYPKKEVLI